MFWSIVDFQAFRWESVVFIEKDQSEVGQLLIEVLCGGANEHSSSIFLVIFRHTNCLCRLLFFCFKNEIDTHSLVHFKHNNNQKIGFLFSKNGNSVLCHCSSWLKLFSGVIINPSPNFPRTILPCAINSEARICFLFVPTFWRFWASMFL